MARERFNMPDVQKGMTDPYAVGGGAGTDYVHGDTHTFVPDVDERARYQSLGEAAAMRQAYQVNYDAANRDAYRNGLARDQQLAAGAQLRNAAVGGAPSSAAIYGNQAAGQSLSASLGATAGARGLAAAAMQQQAIAAQAGQQQQAMGQFAGQRANELAVSRGQYGNVMDQARGGDYELQKLYQQQAEAQGKSELAQRGLNQQGQMAYEQMGFDQTQAESDAKLREEQALYGDLANRQASSDADRARNERYFMAGMSALGGVVASDERVKQNIRPTYDEVMSRPKGKAGPLVAYLDEPAGVERHWDRDVSSSAPDGYQGASLTGPVPRYSVGELAAKAPNSRPKQRKFTDEELKRIVGGIGAGNEASLAAGPSVRPQMGRDLAEGLAPFEYEYKPGFAEAERQAPGEKNVGPMAQNMASNPVTGTAVKRGPGGLLVIDQPKALKVSLGGIGYLAAEQERLKAELAALKERK